MRALKFLLVAIAAVVAGTPRVPAQDWPGKPLHLIVPFAAGGSTDVLTRLLCEQLTVELKTPCVVENKGGAGGNLGGAAVAAAPADGYTFLVSAPGVLAYNKILYREMAFDPDKDLDPICLYAFQPNVLVVHPSLPVKSVAELIAYAKAHPHQLNYASGGVGSTSHVAGELFLDRMAGTISKLTADPAFRARVAEAGAEAAGGTVDEARAFVKEETVKWREVVLKSGAKAD